MPNTLSRRTLLRGTGVAIGLPLLDVMSDRRLLSAESASTAPPLRMAFFYVPNGVHLPDWKPNESGPSYQLTPTLARLAEYR